MTLFRDAIEPFARDFVHQSVSSEQAELARDELGASAGVAIDRKIEREGILRSVALSAGAARISINQDDGAKGWDRIKGQGFSLNITTEQNIDKIANRIKELGGTLDTEPADMPWGVRMFRLKDPDGYKLAISSPRPA